MVGPLDNLRDNLRITENVRDIDGVINRATPPPTPPITPPITLPPLVPSIDLNVNVDINTTFEQILGIINFVESFNIVVINKTNKRLKRVGSFNAGSNWPLRDIDANTAKAIDFGRFNVLEAFTIAANYEIEGENIFVQFGASGPLVTKIGLYKSTRPGNESAEQLAKSYLDNVDQEFSISGIYNARAFMTQEEDSKIWLFEVAPS